MVVEVDKDDRHEKIFVQIATYRDPQLVPTVADLLKKADDPTLFSFGICWQYGPDDDLSALDFVVRDYGSTLRMKTFRFEESKGLCWARSVTNSLYDGERLTLQIDSHHRFVEHWDSLMMQDFERASALSKKPILTTYLPPFDPVAHDADPGATSPTPTLMSQYRFHPNASACLLGSMPWYIPASYASSNVDIARTRILSGHFYLVDGAFCREVPYDPELYFGGEIEEVSMSVRAWTHGYDMWSPLRRKTIAWHEYTRSNRPKHWNDHADWGVLETRSRERFEMLVSSRLDGPYGLGAERSLGDYERFAGIDFAGRRLQRHTLEVKEPPNDPDSEWVSFAVRDGKTVGCGRRMFTARWSAELISNDCKSKSDCKSKLKMLALGLEDSNGRTIVRDDVLLLLDDFSGVSEKEIMYEGNEVPIKFVMWPMFDDGTWGTRQEGAV